MRKDASGNTTYLSQKVRNQSSVLLYSTNNRSIFGTNSGVSGHLAGKSAFCIFVHDVFSAVRVLFLVRSPKSVIRSPCFFTDQFQQIEINTSPPHASLVSLIITQVSLTNKSSQEMEIS